MNSMYRINETFLCVFLNADDVIDSCVRKLHVAVMFIEDRDKHKRSTLRVTPSRLTTRKISIATPAVALNQSIFVAISTNLTSHDSYSRKLMANDKL